MLTSLSKIRIEKINLQSKFVISSYGEGLPQKNIILLAQDLNSLPKEF